MVLIGYDGLHPSSKGARVHLSGKNRPIVTDGPFAESKEVIEFRVASSSNASNVSLIEVNFTQSGTAVSASTANVVLANGTLSNNLITIDSLGGECDGGVLQQDSVEGTFTSATNANFTLSESAGGTASGQVTFSSDGSQLTSGSYTVPAQCGFAVDSVAQKFNPSADPMRGC